MDLLSKTLQDIFGRIIDRSAELPAPLAYGTLLVIAFLAVSAVGVVLQVEVLILLGIVMLACLVSFALIEWRVKPGKEISGTDAQQAPNVLPRFVTERLAANEIGFTVVNPNGGERITITDIQVNVGEAQELQAAVEDRFELEAIAIGAAAGNNVVAIDVANQRSILSSTKVVIIDADDSASFTVKILSSEMVSAHFCLYVFYVTQAGNKCRLASDSVYFFQGETWMRYGRTPVEVNVSALHQSDIESRLRQRDCSALPYLRFYEESDFTNLDVFTLLIELYESGDCKEGFVVERLSTYITTEIRRNRVLFIIKRLDDLQDFEDKYHLITGLVEAGDERVLPFAELLLEKITMRAQLRKTARINPYSALFDLQKKIETKFERKMSILQGALAKEQASTGRE